ncbi:MAG TPA: PPOX class F420-dependent oxidoreductase [Solirubrobacteraceae bacterium]|jgi:PPOX class F420-dependent enzyme/OxyR family protein|nr:PPOX class F420-dependent oxidoreductase [Solirubrobacteraceae bacterium]
MPIDTHHIEYLTTQTHGRLATVSASGAPQNKPVGYRYNAALGTIDIAGFDMERSAKYRNVGVNPDVAFVVDDIVGEGSEGVRFVEVRGPAEHAVDPDRATSGGVSAHIIRIHPRRLVSWNIRPGHDGMYSEDLAADGAAAPAPDRPALGATGARAEAAAGQAIEGLVAELQEGYDRQDADVSNRHFAADLIWGSPFGATVTGYEDLHAIHLRFKERGVGGAASRYEIVQTLAPAPGVAVAQVRRVALGADGNPAPEGEATTGFSEMALYVLVRRGATWWLAAGQNTPIRLSEAPSRT